MNAKIIDSVLSRLSLRDYQEQAVRAFLAGYADRATVKVVSLPTGSGKTVVGVAVAACLIRAGYTVLWACKRWNLLRMAADEFVRHFPELRQHLRRIGGESKQFELGHLSDALGGRLYFTTLQSWYRRRGTGVLARLDPDRLAAVWDEVHWGFPTRVGLAFRAQYLGRAAVLGLTATPPNDSAEVVFQKTFADLVGSVLATPVVESAATGVTWTPTLRRDDYSPESLDVLARAAGRNACIVDKVAALREEGRARHTIVFAISIAHAHELARLLGERGVPARVVHSRQPQAAQEQAIEAFRRGRVDVLVNVAMLAEGFDFPPTDAVVLARPCASRVLLAQMIGRGARKAPGKDTFVVVDVRDDLTRYEDVLVGAADVVPTAPTAEPKGRAYRPPADYSEPTGHPRFENYVIPGHGAVPIALGHTFGVEIELTAKTGVPDEGPQWEAAALGLIAKLRTAVTAPVYPEPLDGRGGPLTHWRVVYDSSAGWEVVSPILMNAGGFDELRRACDAISELVQSSGGGLCVNHRTGLHVTLASGLNTDERLRGFVGLVQRLEPGLFTLVAPSRLYAFDPATRHYSRRAGNRYCLSLRGLGDPAALSLDRFVGDYQNRYRTVNLIKSRNAVPVLEVRMHHGTHEFHKIALWVSLWMQIFNTARYQWTGAARPGLVLPGRNSRIGLAQADREDIVALLQTEGVALTPEFVRQLRRRRAELRPSWAKVVPNRVARWEAAGWYADAARDHSPATDTPPGR